MNKNEKQHLQYLESQVERLERGRQTLLNHNISLARQLEIVCDKFKLTDEQRDEIKRQADAEK